MIEVLYALYALGLTIAVEFCVVLLAALIFLEGDVLHGLRAAAPRVLRAAVLINAFTQPIALYSVRQLHVGVWTVEGMVILVEGLLLAELLEVSLPRAYLISVVANVASAFLPLYFPV